MYKNILENRFHLKNLFKLVFKTPGNHTQYEVFLSTFFLHPESLHRLHCRDSVYFWGFDHNFPKRSSQSMNTNQVNLNEERNELFIWKIFMKILPFNCRYFQMLSKVCLMKYQVLIKIGEVIELYYNYWSVSCIFFLSILYW